MRRNPFWCSCRISGFPPKLVSFPFDTIVATFNDNFWTRFRHVCKKSIGIHTPKRCDPSDIWKPYLSEKLPPESDTAQQKEKRCDNRYTSTSISVRGPFGEVDSRHQSPWEQPFPRRIVNQKEA